jgi:hypothetical protein
VTGGLVLPADLLLPTGPNAPTVDIAAANLALSDPNDDIDALALGGWGVSVDDAFVLIFSVDSEAFGGSPPDAQLTGLGYPFNAQDQVAKNQAPGDAFMSLLLFDRFGDIPPPTRSLTSNNTLVINQGDAGGVDFSLQLGTLPPADPNPGKPTPSNLDAGAGTRPGPPPGSLALRDSSGRRSPSWLLFSLAAGSPSLPAMPGGNGSPADIYIDLDPTAQDGEGLYVGPLTLGLALNDDIDALLVLDDGDHVFESGFDQVIFSLAPGSPSLGSFGPGDIFTSEGFGIFTLYCSADQLGILSSDNVDMLDYVLSDHVATAVYDWAIGHLPKCPGDINGDGLINVSDLGILLAAYDRCQGDYEYYPGADLYGGDACIDLCDLGELLAVYGTSCP